MVVSKTFYVFSLLEEIIQFDYYFSNGLKPPTRKLNKDTLPKFKSSPLKNGWERNTIRLPIAAGALAVKLQGR